MGTVKDDVKKKTALQYVTKAYVPRSVWKHRVCLPQPEHGPSKRNPGLRGCSSDRKPETRDTQKRLVRVLSLLAKPTRAICPLSPRGLTSMVRAHKEAEKQMWHFVSCRNAEQGESGAERHRLHFGSV